MIEDAEALLGPEPSTMGFVKNLFWGNIREELVFPYPAAPMPTKRRGAMSSWHGSTLTSKTNIPPSRSTRSRKSPAG